MVVFRVRRSWLSTTTLCTASEQMFRFKKNLLEILFLAEAAEHNEMGRTRGWKDYSLSSAGIFDTKTRESKQDVVWKHQAAIFLTGISWSRKRAAGKVQHRLVHSCHAGLWPFVWHLLDDQNLSEQLARHLEMLHEGLEPSNSSHTTLPAERGGISPTKSRCMTAPSITPQDY